MTLSVRDLTIEYAIGGYVVRPVQGLSFEAGQGELVVLLGASGCGKTSLLSVVAGILRPASGSVVVAGDDVTILRDRDLVDYRRHQVGIIFQDFNLAPSLSALENVEVAMRFAGMPRSMARQRAVELMDVVGLTHRAGHRPASLSGGERQRVAIARALANDPALLLADEPTAHLDYVQVEEVLRLLRQLASDGRSVVVATHDQRILALADRVVELTPSKARPRRRSRRLDGGDVLFRQGEASDVIYLLKDGRVEVIREGPGGAEERLTVVGAGEYVGELGPILGLQRTATARVCRGGAQVVAISPDAFRSMLGRPGKASRASGAGLSLRTATGGTTPHGNGTRSGASARANGNGKAKGTANGRVKDN